MKSSLAHINRGFCSPGRCICKHPWLGVNDALFLARFEATEVLAHTHIHADLNALAIIRKASSVRTVTAVFYWNSKVCPRFSKNTGTGTACTSTRGLVNTSSSIVFPMPAHPELIFFCCSFTPQQLIQARKSRNLPFFVLVYGFTAQTLETPSIKETDQRYCGIIRYHNLYCKIIK